MSGAMFEEKFIQLVEDNGGFEYYQGYRGDVDHVLGGKGDTFWYIIMKKGKAAETWIGKRAGDAWNDVYVEGSGAERSVPAGTTIKKIAEKAYLMQNEQWVTRRTPKPIEDAHPRYHYVYGFGDKGLDVSVRYGVTISYNDIKDADSAFRLRYLYTGSDVETP